MITRVCLIPSESRWARNPSQSSTSTAKWYGAIRSISSTGVKCRSKLPLVISTTLVFDLGLMYFIPNTFEYHSMVRSGSVVGKFTWWM